MTERFVVVGAGLAGAKAVETLRSEGFAGEIVLFGEEPERPYERPPLSKGLLAGEATVESIYVHPAAFYADGQVDLRTDTAVTGLDLAAHQVRTGAGETLHYDRLLLATGADPRRLDLPGADAPGVHYLRTLADSLALRAALATSPHVVILGAGWIGLEVAAAARTAGAEVDVVEPAPGALLSALGADLGGFYAELHRRHGVRLHFGTQANRFDARAGRIAGVGLSDGRTIPADAVVVGIGAEPRTELAGRAGLEVSGGICTDGMLATSNPDVYAAGDVAAFTSRRSGRRVRIEHWGNALTAGPVAARNMLGGDVVHDPVPYFFSDQYEVGMEFAGTPLAGSRLVYRGEVESAEFVAFWCVDERVVAGMNVNVWEVTDAIQALVRSGRRVDARALADPAVDLAELAG
jgi:NADPH-dependent 2,4-dienoyl-CoA reductase/sulfur reductase-like enzyme